MSIEAEFALVMQPRLDARRWIVGFSGGADSLALLELCRRLPAHPPLLAAHLHHGIRGAEADADAAFCRDYCRRNAIEFVCRRADVPARAKQRGENLEDAARRERRAFFAELSAAVPLRLEGECAGGSPTLLLLAHHQDDQVETVLMRLLRGTGWRGLAGIRAESRIPATADLAHLFGTDAEPALLSNEGSGALPLFRPLLSLRRSTLADFLRSAGLSPREDSSNRELTYTRNRIRLEILPRLQEKLPDCRARLLAAAARANAVEVFITQCARAISCSREWGGFFLSEREAGVPDCGWLRAAEDAVAALLPEHTEFRLRGESQRMLLLLLQRLRTGAREGRGGCLCKDIRARLEGSGIFLFNPRRRHVSDAYSPRSGQLPRKPLACVERVGELRGGGFVCETQEYFLSARMTDFVEESGKNPNAGVVYLAVDSLRFPVLLRYPQRGERLRAYENAPDKTVAAILSDHKLPLRQRERTLVLADQTGILWLPPILPVGRALAAGFAGEALRVEFSVK